MVTLLQLPHMVLKEISPTYANLDGTTGVTSKRKGKVEFIFQKQQLGCVLGPMKNKGNKITQAVLKINGCVVPRRIIRRFTSEDLHSDSEK